MKNRVYIAAAGALEIQERARIGGRDLKFKNNENVCIVLQLVK